MQTNNIKPIVQIGKNGLTETVIAEIGKHLKNRKLIKIKCLKYFIEEYSEGSNSKKMKEIAAMFAEKLNCEASSIGFVITLKKNG